MWTQSRVTKPTGTNMRILCKIDYTTYTADLSGQELETLTKILGKMLRIDNQEHENGVDIVVMPAQPAKLPVTMSVLNNVEVVSRDTWDRTRAIKQQAAIAKAVAKFLSDDSMSSQEFIDDIYYNGGSMISYSEHKTGRGASARRGNDIALVSVIDDNNATQIIEIKLDGTYERSVG
jgi:hypothetical protein